MNPRIVALGLLPACYPHYGSAQGQLGLDATDVWSSVLLASEPLLAGTRFCPTLSCATGCPTDGTDPLECFVSSVSGAGHLDGACGVADAPGTLTWSFNAVACASNAGGYFPVDDQVAIPIVAASDVIAVPVDVEGLVEVGLLPVAGDAFPTDWKHAPGTPWPIVEGATFHLFPRLVQTTDGTEVGWDFAQSSASAVAILGAPAVVTLPGPADVNVVAELGATSEIRFSVGANSWALAEVTGVAATAPTTLEVVVAYQLDPFTGLNTAPKGARAVMHDANGDLVFGAPVEWTLVSGLLAVGDPGQMLPGGDYVNVTDSCVLPSANGGSHTARLTAAYNGLTAGADLSWDTVVTGSDYGWLPSAYCVTGEIPGDPGDTAGSGDTGGSGVVVDTGNEKADDQRDGPVPVAKGGGCGCAQTGGTPSVGLPLALALLGRRRRPRPL